MDVVRGKLMTAVIIMTTHETGWGEYFITKIFQFSGCRVCQNVHNVGNVNQSSVVSGLTHSTSIENTQVTVCYSITVSYCQLYVRGGGAR